LFLAIYLPFGVALSPSSGIDLSSVRVLIVGLFLFWLISGLKSRKVFIANNFQTALIGSFLFLSSFSFFFAQNTDWSFRKLAFLFSIFPIYFVVSNLIDTREKLEKMMKFLIYGGLGAALVAIFQFILQFTWGLNETYNFWAKFIAPVFLGQAFSEAVLKNPSWLVNISGNTYLRAIGLFPDPHMFSFYLGLLIPIAFGLFLKTRKKFYLMSIFVLLLADFLTFSRGAYVGLFSAVIFFFLLSWSNIGKKYKIATFLVISFLFLSLIIPNPISSRFLSSFDLLEGSNQGRILMWRQALEATRDNPLLGVGIGNYPLSVKPTAEYRDPIYAHNTYLDISAETGVLNSFVWIMLLAFSLLIFIRKMKREILFIGPAVSLVIFGTHSVFETGIYSPVVLSVFLIILSFSALDVNENEKNN
jgi:O-antigen ligase